MTSVATALEKLPGLYPSRPPTAFELHGVLVAFCSPAEAPIPKKLLDGPKTPKSSDWRENLVQEQMGLHEEWQKKKGESSREYGERMRGYAKSLAGALEKKWLAR